MQTFLIVVISILLPVAGIIELFQSKEKETEAQVPATDAPPAARKRKGKAP